MRTPSFLNSPRHFRAATPQGKRRARPALVGFGAQSKPGISSQCRNGHHCSCVKLACTCECGHGGK